MLRILHIALVLLLIGPSLVSAEVCSQDGYSIVYVNGILTSEDKAREDKRRLEQVFRDRIGPSDVRILNGYNPSHLAGAGDAVQAAMQAFGRPISDYDLKTILTQIHREVETQKILLVGHSQGTFYTNELYEYLIKNGVPRSAITVYNVATPASFAVDGNKYLTSANDGTINKVREWTAMSGVAQPLDANILIPLSHPETPELWRGHGFNGEYLAGAAGRIVSDIQRALQPLRAAGSVAPKGCFNPPSPTFAYRTQQIFFSVADPMVTLAIDNRKTLATATQILTNSTAYALNSLSNTIAGLFTPSVVPSAGQTSAAVLAVSEQSPVVISTTEEESPPEFPEESAPEPTTASEEAVIVPQPQLPAPASVPPTPFVEPQVQKPEPEVPLWQQFLISIPVTPGYGSGVPTPKVAVANNTPQETQEQEPQQSSALQNVEEEETFEEQEEIAPHVEQPVAPIVRIPACEQSLSSDECIVPATTITVEWEAGEHATHYTVVVNEQESEDVAEMRHAVELAEGDSTIRVIAHNSAGSAQSEHVHVSVTVPQIVINEIGWAGTWVNINNRTVVPGNQWIELKNLSAHAVDMSNMFITRSGGEPIALSGSIGAGAILSIIPHNFSAGPAKLITPFEPLSTAGEQLSLVWRGGEDEALLDATPEVEVCGGWCFGDVAKIVGTRVGGSANPLPLSMERRVGGFDGRLSSSWQSTDTYMPNSPWGTPGFENTEGLPETGVYCGATENIIVASEFTGPAFSINANCVYLTRFISINSATSPTRRVRLYRGEVASSTSVFTFTLNTSSQVLTNPTVFWWPDDVAPGEQFFFALWEQRTGPGPGQSWTQDQTNFNTYFTSGEVGPPHSNYRVIPWVYQP